MMKARKLLIVAGITAAGKTSFCKALELRTGWKHLCIDDYRDRVSDGTMAGEHEAQDVFFRDLQRYECIIYETNAYSKGYRIVKRLLSKHRVENTTVRLICSPEEAHRRITERNRMPPLPYNFNTWDGLWAMADHLENNVPGKKLDSERLGTEELIRKFLGE